MFEVCFRSCGVTYKQEAKGSVGQGESEGAYHLLGRVESVTLLSEDYGLLIWSAFGSKLKPDGK